MSGDTAFLLQAVGMGIGITFLYDWLRIFRRVLPHRQIVVSLEDLFFWIFCTMFVFWWMYRVSNGGMRWFAIAGALTGMGLYKKFISRLLVTYVSLLLKRVLEIIEKILRILLRPVRYLGMEMGQKRKAFSRKKRKVAANVKIWLKNCLKVLKIKLSKR